MEIVGTLVSHPDNEDMDRLVLVDLFSSLASSYSSTGRLYSLYLTSTARSSCTLDRSQASTSWFCLLYLGRQYRGGNSPQSGRARRRFSTICW